jgi:hypothetical protein
MDTTLVIFIVITLIYLPLAGVQLYVWWKHGKDEPGVAIARAAYLFGSFLLFVLLITL